MTALDITQFDTYFRELHGHKPYYWQRQLAERAIAGDWPGAIDLPTSSGKTACLDVAIFALACQASQRVVERTAPVRLFFCVNRRVIVDEAHQRAKRIARKLWQAERNEKDDAPVLQAVAAALRTLAGTTPSDDVPPLDVLELRGGIYRDNRWARSATQPTIICTTVDQLGSRLLFRGYGVSGNAAPIQAALVAYDSLVLLDEAHISKPFLQTLTNVRGYLDPEKWAEHDLGVNPVTVVPMTATPPEGVGDKDVIHLVEEDRKNESLDDRLTASKPAELRNVKDIVSAAVQAAEEFGKEEPRAVGVIVNRVATARAVYRDLRKRHPDAIVELVIGSMRPVDRDEQSERLRPLIGPERPVSTTQSSFVVSTQCLEVGADYDFDALVTECASLDALRQRFGRLNRAGRPVEERCEEVDVAQGLGAERCTDFIDAKAVILVEKKSIKAEEKLKNDKPEDPIYGNALARTWNWLSKFATTDEAGRRTVDFGVDAFDGLLVSHGENGRIPRELLAPSALLDAPVMLPAHVDLWCQTSPRPAPDPDVSLFLHGQQRGEPDVQVCWRGDLIADGHMDPGKHWSDVVSLLPPTSAECMTVPLSRTRRWLAKQQPDDNDGDLLGMVPDEDDGTGAKNSGHREQPQPRHRGVLWRGAKDSVLITSPRNLRPGDTLVIPADEGGWNELGHVPCPIGEEDREPGLIDVAELAFKQARDQVALRIHQLGKGRPSSLRSRLPAGSAVDELFNRAASHDDRPNNAEWRELMAVARDALGDDAADFKATVSSLIECGFTCEVYPDDQGVVLTTRKRSGAHTDWFLPPLDEGDDSASRIRRRQPVSLTDHTQHVIGALHGILARLPVAGLADALHQAAEFHDLGKADERFQAMLRRTDRTDAWLLVGRASNLIAKSDGLPQTREQRHAARQRAGMPEGFRHEMLSVQLAEQAPESSDDPLLRDLVFHLIAAHHGYARPFAPVVVDDDPPDMDVEGLSLTTADRLSRPLHRLDSGVAERFWTLTRRFGWWGLAYIESVLRLADQQASAAEESSTFARTPNDTASEVTA